MGPAARGKGAAGSATGCWERWVQLREGRAPLAARRAAGSDRRSCEREERRWERDGLLGPVGAAGRSRAQLRARRAPLGARRALLGAMGAAASAKSAAGSATGCW